LIDEQYQVPGTRTMEIPGTLRSSYGRGLDILSSFLGKRHNKERSNITHKLTFANDSSLYPNTMGRITIFTSDDIHSKFLKKEFDRNYIPYTEISVARFPRTLYDLLGLAHTTAVPQVFFNERCVGGVTETLRELRIWRDNSRYRSLYNGYWCKYWRNI